MEIIKALAEFVSGLAIRDLSARDQQHLENHFIDTVAASICGAATPDGQALLSLQNTKMGSLNALSPTGLDDVVTRCAMTRLSEIDDIHLPSGTTPGSIIIPTALVLAKHLGISDRDLVLNAILSGYEAMTRLGVAVDGQNLVYKGVWTTYFAAPFGTAAVASRLLGLGPSETAQALAIALTLLSGRMGKPGSRKTSRWLMAGYAARNGCFAALSAAQGFTGDLSLLDGPWMENAHGIAIDRDSFTRDQSICVVPQISIKPWCSAKQMIAAIAGFEDILARGIDPGKIDKVEVTVPPNYSAMIDHGVVEGDRLSSATSAPYQLAMAAFHPEGLRDVARVEYILTPKVLQFMEKVSVCADAGLLNHLPANWPAHVKVIAGDRQETVEILDAPGDPARAFGRKKTEAKLREFAGPVIGDKAAGDWLNSIAGALDGTDNFSGILEKFIAIGRV